VGIALLIQSKGIQETKKGFSYLLKTYVLLEVHEDKKMNKIINRIHWIHGIIFIDAGSFKRYN